MARPTTPMKQTRTRHSQAYKDEALALAERISVSKAAEQLGLHASQLYSTTGGARGSRLRPAASASSRWPTRTLGSSDCWLSKLRSWPS